MSQYSEMMGSFIRTGNYPLEADYIFNSEDELKSYYELPENNVLLHKGWLKVVVNSNEQALYWVTKKETNDELEFTKLITSNNIEQIDSLIELLNKEIAERKAAIDGIYGAEDHTLVPTDLSNLLKIALKIKTLATQESVDEIIDFHDEFLSGFEDYSTLKEILELYVSDTLIPVNDDVIELTITPVLNGTQISGKLLISNADGNLIIKKTDGIYYNLKSEYNNGTLTIRVNDYIISQHNIGLSAIVESAIYDSDSESIIITFKLLSGDKLIVTIPAGNLIREWEVDNSGPSKVVELTREEVYAGGADKLSGDVRLSSSVDNIIEKDGNTLIVKGLSDNIKHNGEYLNIVIDKVLESVETFETDLTEIKEKVTTFEQEVIKIPEIDNRVSQTETNILEIYSKLEEIQSSISKLWVNYEE